MISVVKRDGEVAEFSLNKITEAIKKAFKATKKDYNNEILELLSLRVTADFQEKMKDGCVSVEQIQDSVEHVLEQTGYTDVAKAYILYRKQREKIRNMKNTILDYKDVVNSYVKVEDWRVKENSTVTYSVGGLILSLSLIHIFPQCLHTGSPFRGSGRKNGDRDTGRNRIYGSEDCDRRRKLLCSGRLMVRPISGRRKSGGN